MAKVACRQLGFSYGALATTPSHFFAPRKTMHPHALSIDTMSCGGNETALSNCSSTVPREGYWCPTAGTYGVAGVVCQTGQEEEPFARLLNSRSTSQSLDEGFPFVGIRPNGSSGDWLFGGICDQVRYICIITRFRMHN